MGMLASWDTPRSFCWTLTVLLNKYVLNIGLGLTAGRQDEKLGILTVAQNPP